MEQLDSKTVFASPFVDVTQKRFRRVGGEVVERQVVEHPGAVGILAHDDEAEHWTRLHAIYPSPGYLSERLTIFEATGLSESQARPMRPRTSRWCGCRWARSMRRSRGSRTRRR